MPKGPLPRISQKQDAPNFHSGPVPEPTDNRPQSIPDPGDWNDAWNISMDGGGPNIPSDHITSPDPVSLWIWSPFTYPSLSATFFKLRELDPNIRMFNRYENGAWVYDLGGSTATNLTGPGTNNPDPFVYYEGSGSGSSDSLNNSPIYLSRSTNSVITDFLANKTQRSIRIIYSAAGDWFRNTMNGLYIKTHLTTGHVIQRDMMTLSRNIGWPYSSNGYIQDELMLDYVSGQFTSNFDGGWKEISVNIPDDVRSMAIVVDTTHSAVNGAARHSDLAITEIELAGL